MHAHTLRSSLSIAFVLGQALAGASLIGCSDSNIYVWVAAIWNQNAIEFAAESSEADWVWVNANVTDVLANGFQPPFPGPGNPYNPPKNQPHVYVIVATPPH